MKFAAGLTVSGIIGLLAIALKILLIGVGLVLAAGAIGLAFFLYRRSQKSRAEV